MAALRLSPFVWSTFTSRGFAKENFSPVSTSRSRTALECPKTLRRFSVTVAGIDTRKDDNGSLTGAFDELKLHLTEISALEGVKGLLFWDQQVMMPAKGFSARGAQSAAVAKALHAKRTDPGLGRCIERLSAVEDFEQAGFTKAEAASIVEAARDFQRAMKMPAELEAKAAALSSKANQAWQQAKKERQFGLFAPVLQEWIDLQHKMAAAVEPDLPAYDYCLDTFERGMTTAKLDPVFQQLKQPLIEMAAQIQASGVQVDRTFMRSMDLFSGHFSKETQKRLARRFAEEIGFDFERGRLDESVHPFTMGVSSPLDVRLTSKFIESDLTSGLRATLHEAGHGLYEQGRNAELSAFGLPASRPRSLGLHESQSLLWERQVGMSSEFWGHYWPIVLRSFSSLPRSEPLQFYKVMNEVKPSLIRVDADEVTYPLHILLRYEMERSLMEGTLEVKDVPAVWNEKMAQYLGVVPDNDGDGCLQDIHWSAGLFGYFPTYTLGALYASQIFDAAERAMPSLRSDIRQGKFLGLREWLRVNIHDVGSLHPTADDIVERVTGKRLDPSCFLSYLKKKYSSLYNIAFSEDLQSVAA